MTSQANRTWTKVAAGGVALGIATAAVAGLYLKKDASVVTTPNSNNQQKEPPKKSTKEDTNPNAVLKQIAANYIKMDPAVLPKAKKIVELFIRKDLIDAMKEVDSLFKVMFRNIYYTGSFFDGLRIENPDEFDLNIVLDLKLPKKSFQLVKNQLCSAGYVQLQVDSPERTVSMNMQMYGLVPKLMKLLKQPSDHEKYFFMPGAVRKWIIGVVDKALNNLKNLHRIGILKVHRKESGPATTLIVYLEDGNTIDIDLVPVFAFNPKELEFYKRIWSNIDTSRGGPHWLQGHQSKFQRAVRTTLGNEFFIVPKPSANLDSEWRLDFHDPEIKIIDDIGCAKPVIKFLKLFRNSNSPLRLLSSYSLKTIVMDMRRIDPRDDWAPAEEAEHFLKALKYLQLKLEHGKIDYFFDDHSNILWKQGNVKQVQLQNMVNFLKKAIKSLETSQNTPTCKTVWTKILTGKNLV